MKEEQLLTYLKANCAGRQNTQTRAQLQRALNISKDQLTNLVHRMRCKGMPIAGGPEGYFYAQNAGELHATIRWLEKMVRTLLKSIHGLEGALEKFTGPTAEAHENGAPTEAQRSGFGGERRSDEVGELSGGSRKRASEVRSADGGGASG